MNGNNNDNDNTINDASMPTISIAASTNSTNTTSSYRHHQSPPFKHNNKQIQQLLSSPPQQILLKDATHEPKTRGSVGILLVEAASTLRSRFPSTTPSSPSCLTLLLAGILANRNKISWRGPQGQWKQANYQGTVTQQQQSSSMSSSMSLSITTNNYSMADLNMAAIGGWDVPEKETHLGDSLLESQLLDYELVIQIKDEMNQYKLFRPFYDATTVSEAISGIRADIRYFKWKNGVVGHTSILWNTIHDMESWDLTMFITARDVLDATEDDGIILPPALIYALAALLEGCSFINAPHYIMDCPGMKEIIKQQPGVYCVGTDFRKTFVEQGIIDTLHLFGLQPQQQQQSQSYPQSSTNNQQITSSAFLGQPHTVMTVHQTHPAILTVPLMLDAAVLCDYFSSKSWPHDKVASAMSYLFMSSTSTSLASQMENLKWQIEAAASTNQKSDVKKRVRIRPEETTTEWAIPHDASIICAGLACVDMQLHHATTSGGGGESIETFQGETSIGGGSVSMACKTLARLCHGAPLDDGYMQVTPPVVHSIVPLCKIGSDDTGIKLVSLLEACGSACRNVDTKYLMTKGARTALAVLPIFPDGRRGCYFDAASNDTFSSHDMMEMIRNLTTKSLALDESLLSEDDMEHYRDRVDGATPVHGAFLFGYPHLLPLLQGEALADVFLDAKSIMMGGGIIVMDLNGVPEGPVTELKRNRVIGPALEHVDILHMNEDELQLLTGCHLDDDNNMANAVQLFLQCGVAIVVVTRGRKGSFVSCNDEARFAKSEMLPHSWIDCSAKINAVELPRDTIINTNGAGDSFTAGFLVAAMLRHTGLTMPTTPTHNNTSCTNGDVGLELIKIVTPYQLYMKENYVSLKNQCNDDKRAIFTKCHDMWEKEGESVKVLYDRKASHENESLMQRTIQPQDDHQQYMANRALTLESAVQFASLVAAHHVDTSIRNLSHIDVTRLLERSMIFPDGLEEI